MQCSKQPPLFYLIGGGEQRRWHGETEFLSGLEINDEIEVGRLLDQETTRLWGSSDSDKRAFAGPADRLWSRRLTMREER
jgi:hypothetical protein